MASSPLGSDPWLDAQLRNVRLPPGLLPKINQALLVTDEEMDAQLQAVPLPDGLLDQCRRISRVRRRRRSYWGSMAMAASLLVAAGLVYFKGEELWSRIEQLARGPRPNTADQQKPNAGGDQGLADSPVDDQIDLPNEDIADAKDPLDPSNNWEDWEPMIAPIPFVVASRADAYGPLYLTDGTFDNLPELETVRRQSPRGIAPPLVRGYDLVFQLKYGDHPFVNPAANRDLQTSQAPLVTSAASYELAWRYLKDKHLPPPEDVRVEEFLAALDYGFPPPSEGALAIRTAAGPAPFGEPGLRMLQVGVQAGPLPPQGRAPTHLTIAIDTSQSMQRGGRLEIARRVLAQLVGQLDLMDHVSLVGFSDQAELLVENAGRENVETMLAAIQSLRPHGTTNIGAGLNLACSAARRGGETGAAQRLVLVTDGLAELTPETTQRIETLLASAATDGVGFQIVDLALEHEADPQLEEQLAAAGHGRVVHADTTDALRWTLTEDLIGRSSIVASGAALKVTFNPQTVAAYRLLGHEATTLTGADLAHREVELRAGEAATALFEVKLKPGGGDDVAVAELSWSDPGSGQSPHHVSQRISRLQFAKTYGESPLSLQIAVLAAETAEVLRGSYFAPSSRPLARVLELAEQDASPRLRTQPSFREFVAFIKRAEQVRLSGAALRKAAAKPGQ